MMGAVIFKLRAEQDAVLPAVNGRLMHAAFFHLLQEVSPDASAYLHDKLTMKPFTVSMLSLPEWKRGKFEGIHTVTKGTVFYWRVTALWEKLLQMILSVPRGYHVQAGFLLLWKKYLLIQKNMAARGCLMRGSLWLIPFP